MRNKFEGTGGFFRRHRTDVVEGEQRSKTQIVYGDMLSPRLTIDITPGAKFPKVRSDGEGGYVVRPSRWGRKDRTAIDVYASNGAHVWVSRKVTLDAAKSIEKANLSVRTFTNKGLAESAATFHVRGDAPLIEASDHASVRVGGTTDQADLSNPVSFVTNKAKEIYKHWNPGEGIANIFVRRGKVETLHLEGDAHVSVLDVHEIITEGENNTIVTTLGYDKLDRRDGHRPIITTPGGREYPQGSSRPF